MDTESKEKFMIWFLDKHLKYGDWFTEWWDRDGKDIFFAYARARGQEFIELHSAKEEGGDK